MWRDRLEAAFTRASKGLRPAFTQEDRARAGDFKTCAVGEKRRALQIIISMPDDDREMFDLGLQFCEAVSTRDNVVQAMTVYLKIQKRTRELKKDLSQVIPRRA